MGFPIYFVDSHGFSHGFSHGKSPWLLRQSLDQMVLLQLLWRCQWSWCAALNETSGFGHGSSGFCHAMMIFRMVGDSMGKAWEIPELGGILH